MAALDPRVTRAALGRDWPRAIRAWPLCTLGNTDFVLNNNWLNTPLGNIPGREFIMSSSFGPSGFSVDMDILLKLFVLSKAIKSVIPTERSDEESKP